MKFSRKLFCLSLIFSLFLTACAPSGNFAGGEKISIAYAEPIGDFSPTTYESNSKKYLSNIYETLVRYDKTFNYETALATSWGRYDDLTWEFRLREGVLFHDGSVFDADDAVFSLESAMSAENSQLSSLLANIDRVEKVDAQKIRIITKKIDPLLLNKLVNVYIFPSGYGDFNRPVGSGPYLLKSIEGGDWNLERFDAYWGPAPFFKYVTLTAIANPDERLEAILSNKVQVLANVPPQYAEKLKEQSVKVTAFPSLEVSYLMFNFDSVFQDKNLREAVNAALGVDYANKFGAGYLLPTSQFAALGIFGYSKSFADRVQNVESALTLRNAHEGDVNVTLDLPTGLEKLGARIQADLEAINISVTLNVLDSDAFQNKILSGQSDFYFFGWKYDLADLSDFFETVLHSNADDFGTFNGMNYADEQVDEYILEASETLDPVKRRNIIQSISKEILEAKVGIPLFEAEVLYGLRPELFWDIRLDGLILASEIVGKGV